MIGILEQFVAATNNILWSYILIVMLIVLGLYFTVKSRFVQFRMIVEMVRLLGEGAAKIGNKKTGVSSFQAFCISTASRVGTGNLAGVAIAITLGGPGAVFWMWLIALIGAGSSFVESTLAQIYKVKDENGFRGGPAYYIEQALGIRWLGVVFSILITITFGLVFNSVQSNTISFAVENAFGVDRAVTGILLTVMTVAIIFGGVKRVAKVSEIIVPIMAVSYVIVALFVIIKNFSSLPSVFALIFSNAFGLNSMFGGGVGAAMMMGIKRGLFSNEAGMGSAPNAAATATVSHPVKQGLIQTLGVFTDTLLICSATAAMILLSGAYKTTGAEGIQLTQNALSSQVGAWGNSFIAVCIFMFAFSSVIGNYYYGETNIEFIKADRKWLFAYRIAVSSMVMVGAIAKIQIVWDMADLFMGLMAIINLGSIAFHYKKAIDALDDYTRQKKMGLDPVFYKDSIEGIDDVECWNYSPDYNKKAV
ncbi:sodium/glutamine symporter GlnT (plasmid) [Peptoclostridium acidaminophilum DSM 3953]|uniref:Sodium/glutamine symporter GlnT n=1 Tax=Peptoclostridium acidaminophilum DSM 3953 TaxID=1286171 RepID=W8UB91_PEPAC|nr:sodium/glutamine symporter GlnT [Peptoclostridium acidaminophilum DSM 3953]